MIFLHWTPSKVREFSTNSIKPGISASGEKLQGVQVTACCDTVAKLFEVKEFATWIRAFCFLMLSEVIIFKPLQIYMILFFQGIF